MQNTRCTLPETVGQPLNRLAGASLSNLLASLTGIGSTCARGTNLLRLNLTTHTNINVGILSLYATADGKLGLAIRLNCYYVIAAGTSISITGTILGAPINIYLPVRVNDGGLVSCVVHTVTTAIPFTGCLLAGLDARVNLNLPLAVTLGPDMTGCTGLLPALTGSLLHVLGINLKVVVPVYAAAFTPADGTCRVPPARQVQPLTVTVLAGKPNDGYNCGGNAKAPYPYPELLKLPGLPGLNLFNKGPAPPPKEEVPPPEEPLPPAEAPPQCFQCRVSDGAARKQLMPCRAVLWLCWMACQS
jgi:hypothetical protein